MNSRTRQDGTEVTDATDASSATSRLTTVDALAQASFLIQGMLESRAGEHDVSLIQTRLLGILRDREPTINELARLLELDKSSVSGLVDRAERRGLVERRRSATDGRSVLVALTPAGRRLVGEVAARFSEDIAVLLEPLPASSRELLTALLEQMLAARAAE